MHIAVEASTISRNLRGMGRYARALLDAMPQHRPALRYTLFARNADDVGALTAQLAPFSRITERATIRPLAELTQTDCDVAWYPCNFITTTPRRGALVPTVHDLFPMLLLDGRWWKVIKRQRARTRYRHTVSAADHIITGATGARDELVRVFGLATDRISVVPHAADDFRIDQPPTDIASRILQPLGVTGPFLLAVGSQEPRKNLPVLYEAMRQLDASGCRIPLVLCGPRGVHGYRQGDALPRWLRHAGFVSDADLSALYAQATALVFPSRYEGFGLPVLEALTAGGVVISSNASTLPEVGGDAVLYFPPDDPAALAAQVQRLLDDPALAPQLRTRGAVQAARFSWSRAALRTLEGFDLGIAMRAATRGGPASQP